MSSSSKQPFNRIEDLIPHKGRMILIEEVLEVDDSHCVSQAIANSHWPLHNEGMIDSIITIELVAQTAAYLVGWKERNKEGANKKGFMTGIKKTTLAIPNIAVGSKLMISCKKVVSMENYAEFEGDVRDDNRTYSNIQIQLFRP